MASSLTSPQLVFSTEKIIAAAQPALLKTKVFSTDFSPDAAQPGSTLKVPIINPGTASQFDATTNNYANADGALTFADVTFANHVKVTFNFSDTDFLEFKTRNVWGKAVEESVKAISRAVDVVVSGLINKTNIPKSGSPFSSKNEVVFSSVTLDSFAKLRAKCSDLGIDPADTVAMLEPTTFATIAALLPANAYGDGAAIRRGLIPELFGFKACIENRYLSTDSAEKLVGALVPANAIAVAARKVEVQSPAIYQEAGYATDDETGFTLTVRRFGTPATGMNTCAVEALFGASLIQPAKCIRLVSQATA